MKKMKRFFTCLILMLATVLLGASIAAQQKITGKVTGIADGQPLISVNVVANGTTTGVMTDVDGKYEISVPAGVRELVFSYIGYSTITVSIVGKTVVDVKMAEDVHLLTEIVVTGYGGTQVRSKLTNSISTVAEQTIKTGIYSNPAQALSGAVSGLKVVQTSGNPGALPVITLRGGTGFDGSGSPLYIVDGQVRNNLSDINPEDIESMEVLKDAGATAIYGARANNGVVLIATRRGKEGKTEISAKVRVGLNYLNSPYNFLNARDYLYWTRTAINNASNIYQKNDGSWVGYTNMTSLTSAGPFGTGNKYFDTDGITPLDGNKTSLAIWSPMLYTSNLDFLLNQGWKKMTDPVTGSEIVYSEFDRSSTAFNHPAITQDYSFSASGGNDKGTYYAGFGYNYAQQLPVKGFYNRLNFTFNGDYKIRDWLISYSSLQFSESKWYNVSNTSETNYFSRMLSGPPTMREYNAAGELLLGNSSGDGNPLYNIDKFQRNNVNNKFSFGQTFRFDIVKDLDFRINAIWLYDDTWNESFNQDFLSSPGNINITRATSAKYDKLLRQTYNAVASYDLKINENHTFNVLGGLEYFDAFQKGFSAGGSGAPTDDFADLQYTSTKEGRRNIDSWHSQERILSAFGRLNYDYLTKYLLSFTFREDGYSKLLGDNRWGFFPGVSAGWVLSKETFMSNNKYISFLKFRSSYGQNGNVSGIGTYTLQGSYTSSIYNQNSGYTIGAIANPTLTWEYSNTFEIGTDIGLFQNRFIGNITWYNRLTANKYASIPLPESSGISSITSNNGSLRNKGLEIDITAKIVRKNNLSWDVSANITRNTNIVEKLPFNGLERNRQGAFRVYGDNNDTLWVGGYQEGQIPGAIYAFEALGIYADDSQVSALAGTLIDKSTGGYGSNNKVLYGPEIWATMTDAQKASGLPIQPGHVIWKDVNEDGIIDDFDKVYIGSSVPKWFGGLSTTISWKGLTLYARTDYALGFYQKDFRLPWFMGMMQGAYNTVTETLESWTPTNTNATYPKYMWADQLGYRDYARESTLFIYKASYLAFREVFLSYSLPEKWIDPAGIEGLEFSVSGQNLGYLTRSKLNRPEATGTGTLDAAYSIPRTVIFGLNVRF